MTTEEELHKLKSGLAQAIDKMDWAINDEECVTEVEKIERAQSVREDLIKLLPNWLDIVDGLEK